MDDKILEKLEKEDKQLADIVARFIAFVADFIICYILIFILMIYFINDEEIIKIRTLINNEDYINLNILLFSYVKAYFIIKFFYVLIFFYMYGATFGNMITKTKIVNCEHFDTPNFTESLNRALVFVFCEFFINGVLFVSIFFNKTRRNFADIASKSMVIKVD
ncbi:RDD family protein [Campylobacter sp. RM12654]|uniref:RDD family protein n=1 Tax=unclassified Campylobacter TaxID=2593542 RepID=UPI0030149C5E|nr:RDD family protein [Campylobacter sp. RM12637]MBZ7977538.1 RDD family protein [Campylobacter sp. RM12654]